MLLLAAMVSAIPSALWLVEPREYVKQCDPMQYGAKGDGVADDTKAVQQAIDACLANATAGEVVLPANRAFLCGPLLFSKPSGAGLTFGVNSTLRISNDRASWPVGQDFLTIEDADGFAVTGQGLVDGQGWVWWENRDDFRPITVNAHGDNLLIRGVTFVNPPTHCLELRSSHTEVDNVTILAPPSTGVATPSHNTDAVDVHGSPFYVHDCYFDTGDDNIAAHANDTLVQDCVFGTGHGASIGSLAGGSYNNITFDRITFRNTTTAIRIKTQNNATSGVVTNVTYSNLVMHSVATVIDITQFYEGPGQGDSKLFIDGVRIVNVTATGTTQSAGEFVCQEASPCKNIEMQNVSIEGVVAMNFTCAEVQGTAVSVSPKSCF
ncbi:Polygalacturonase [Diplonema papillatum]|nr:Polygalacturonase [Diplonema papillatum]